MFCFVCEKMKMYFFVDDRDVYICWRSGCTVYYVLRCEKMIMTIFLLLLLLPCKKRVEIEREKNVGKYGNTRTKNLWACWLTKKKHVDSFYEKEENCINHCIIISVITIVIVVVRIKTVKNGKMTENLNVHASCTMTVTFAFVFGECTMQTTSAKSLRQTGDTLFQIIRMKINKCGGGRSEDMVRAMLCYVCHHHHNHHPHLQALCRF